MINPNAASRISRRHDRNATPWPWLIIQAILDQHQPHNLTADKQLAHSRLPFTCHERSAACGEMTTSKLVVFRPLRSSLDSPLEESGFEISVPVRDTDAGHELIDNVDSGPARGMTHWRVASAWQGGTHSRVQVDIGRILVAASQIDIDLEERSSRDIVRAVAGNLAEIGIVGDEGQSLHLVARKPAVSRDARRRQDRSGGLIRAVDATLVQTQRALSG